jgi:hypothetical protein
LFNIGLEKVVINIEINPRSTIFNTNRKFTAYVLLEVIGRAVGALNAVLTQIQTAAISAGLAINTYKITCKKTKGTVHGANIHGHNFEG